MSDIYTSAVYGGMFDSTSVTETVGGFPRGNKAVDSDFFAKLISCFYRDGVLGEDSFAPTAGGTGQMKVTLSVGVAWIRGYMAWLKTALPLTVTAGMVSYIKLRLNTSSGEFKAVVSDSEELADTSSVKELLLCSVDVPSGATSVLPSMVTDTRSDREVCGYVTSTIDALETVETAENALSLGGSAASAYVKRSGGTMSGLLKAASETTGRSAVRNISYGSSLPSSLADGEIFILVED